MGTAIAIASRVTYTVPIMNGQNPNSPFSGYHEDENSRCVSGLLKSIGDEKREQVWEYHREPHEAECEFLFYLSPGHVPSTLLLL
jgi:hypothetical protein